MSALTSISPIAFVSQAGASEVQQWISALQAAMPEERILPFEQLDADQLAQCRVAIVANPDPAQLKRMPNLLWVHSVWAGVERLFAEGPADEIGGFCVRYGFDQSRPIGPDNPEML